MSDEKRIKELFLFDILIAIAKIEDIVKDFEDGETLLYSYKDWDSVIREFEIIGEAMRYCLQYGLFEESLEKRKVVDFRNIVAHKYFGIDADAVLSIAKNDLVWLEDVVCQRIGELDHELKRELLQAMIEENHYLDFVINKLEKLDKGK